jgi:hypothetical protein
MDFTPPLPAPDVASFGPDLASSHIALEAYIELNFAHRGQGGWFFLLAARVMFPFTAQPVPADVIGATFDQYPGTPERPPPAEWGPPKDLVIVRGVYPRVGIVHVQAPHGTAQPNDLAFVVAAQRSYPLQDRTLFVLYPHDIQDRFEAGDGSLSNAYAHTVYYYLSGRLDAAFEPGGYDITGRGRVWLNAERLNPAGISPAVEVGGRRYFAGRTVVFTDGSDPNGDTEFIAHELCHGFGLPHRCGYYHFRPGMADPGGNVVRGACIMNYGGHAMIVDRGRRMAAAPWPPLGAGGCDFCGKHIRELRRTVLSRNPGFGWP